LSEPESCIMANRWFLRVSYSRVCAELETICSRSCSCGPVELLLVEQEKVRVRAVGVIFPIAASCQEILDN